MRWRRRWLGLLALVAGGVLVAWLLPDAWENRILFVAAALAAALIEWSK